MTRETIQLHPDKVKLHIARSGIAIKQLLEGMNPKTVHRIKAGNNTTTATAYKLATKLNTTVDNLISPIKADEMDGFLPVFWLYDQVDAPSGIKESKFISCCHAIGGYTCLMDQSPTHMVNPIEKLLQWFPNSNRKIVLRQEDQAFIVEIHYFDYSHDQAQDVLYTRATACRFFPLARNGDTFKKTDLSDLAFRYVWNSLHEKALARAELLSIEGHDYPGDPRAYFPLVRFSRGLTNRRTALGTRKFVSQYDLRESLLGYLKGIPNQRVEARLTESGIAMTVKPMRPAIFNPDWWSDELEFKVNMAWRMPDGTLALAPWRDTSRQQFITGIGSRNWRDLHMDHMPLRFFSEDGIDEDAEIPPFEADPSLPAEILASISAHDHLALL